MRQKFKMKSPLVYALCVAIAAPAWSAERAPLRGSSSGAGRTERDREAKFRAIPDPAALRAYRQRLSARPHHVGAAYDKANAEWIAAKAREWGLDAQIETFDVPFPTPKERAAVERSMSYKATAANFRQQVEDQKGQVENLKSALLKL
jgi:N-acetylated-alpha-linked acidic dipeptidase